MFKRRPSPPTASARRPVLRRQSVALVAAVVLGMLLIGLFGLLDGPELRAIDWAFERRGQLVPASPIAIVAIDDNTFAINNLQWPWPRTYFAQLVDRLAAAGARTVAFDVFFFEPEALGSPATYTVQGESLSDLARQYGVETTALIAANNLDNTGRLCGGQTLTIPTNPVQLHLVVRDTLADLAARYGLDEQALLTRNGLTDPCDLRPAQLLQIPVGPWVDYTIKTGQTLASISELFQINPLAITTPADQALTAPVSAGQVVRVHFGDAAFAAAIQGAGMVVLNGEIARSQQAGSQVETLRQPLAVLRQAAAGFGLTNIGADADGAVHAIQAWDRASDRLFYSWPLVAASIYAGQPLDDAPTRAGFYLGSQRLPLENGTLLVNYRGPQAAIPTYSALQVVNGDLPLQTFRDRIVFVGATTQSLHDIYATPFVTKNPPGVPGVEIMASALDTVVGGDFLVRWSGVCAGSICPISARLMLLASILVCGALALGLTLVRNTTLAIAALVGLAAAAGVAWLTSFLAFRTELPLVAPVSTLFLAFVTPSLERAVAEELEKRRVRGIFEMFISPEMVGQLIEQGIEAMRGKRTELTILFSDIRGFTTMSEKMTPEELVNLLNEYLGAMTEVIHRHGGTVDKYEGDLVMAFFGAPVFYPDHAQRAVRCSIDMRQELDRLRAKWASENKPSKLEMGIGLNTAEVFVGLVGSGRRVNYTVMGDGVNLASRVQDLTKDLKWPLLITEFTYERVKDQFECEFGEARLVKGKTVPVGMYKVIHERGAPDDKRVRPLFT